jgi:hypothetical protein
MALVAATWMPGFSSSAPNTPSSSAVFSPGHWLFQRMHPGPPRLSSPGKVPVKISTWFPRR